MKKLLFTALSIVLFAVGASAQGVLKFDKEVHDFGKQNEGPIVTTKFVVTNTGKVPVVITNAQPSCGCTTPEWSKEPIMPGAKSEIKVGFNTSGRPGAFDKTITVVSNAENGTMILKIKGTVVPKAEEPKAGAAKTKQ
jgi:Protein of unknown function (DUF1573)